MKQIDREVGWQLFWEELICDWGNSRITLNTMKSFVKITYFGLMNKVAMRDETIREQAKRIAKLERLISHEGD